MGVLATRMALRGVALIVSVALVAGLGLAPGTAFAAGATQSTTELGVPSLDPKPVGRTATIVATVTPGATGNVEFHVDATLVETVALSGGAAQFTLGTGLAEGAHAVVAFYAGDETFAPSASNTVAVTVGPRPAAALVTSVSGPHDSSGATAQKGDVLTVTVAVTDAGTTGSIDPAGLVDIKVDGVTMATVTLPGATGIVGTAALALGTRSITAVYTPSGADHETDTSPPIAVSVVANVVEAVQFAPTRATFYPYKDGYKDTTSFRGRRDEPASVKVSIYSPTNRLVRTLSVGTGTGAWTVPWNGRNTAGTIVAGGKYRVVQAVYDGITTRKLTSQYVVVSAKRIYTYTKTLKQSFAQRDAGAPSKGWVGWKFTLPSAAVYKKLVFGIYGRSGQPLSVFGPHDYSQCPSPTTWSWKCTWPYAYFPTSTAWKSLTGSTSYNRHGTTVRMYAISQNSRTSVGYARVVVTYGVLK